MKLRELFSLFSKKVTLRPVIKEKNAADQMEDILQEYKDMSGKRQRMERYARRIKKRKEDLKQYENLKPEDNKKVTQLLEQYKSIVEQRKLMEGRLIKNNPALRIIQEYEDEMPELIKEIKATENNQRYSHNDILYLEDEKNYLYDYREDLITGYKALRYLAIALVIILGIACIMLLTMVQALRENIFIPSSIIAIVTFFFVFGILIFKRRIEYELERNEIMQQKAMKMLNTAKIRYFHHTNYLNFQYKKLGVINSDQLQGHYDRYLKNKNNEVHYQKMNNQLENIESKVFDILYESGIEDDIISHIDEWAEIQNVEKLLANLEDEENNMQKQISALDAYEQDLSKQILTISKAKPELAKVAEAFIKRINI